MRCLFLGTELNKALSQDLFAQKVEIDKKSATDILKIKNESPYDLIVFAPKRIDAVSDLSHLRRHSPEAWIVLVADPTWLKDEVNIQTIFNLTEKNEVWLKDHWPTTFPFFFQTFLRRSAGTPENPARQIEALNEQVATLVQQLERDVELAARIHRILLPKNTPKIPGVEIAVRYLPATGKGGDYYDIFEFGDKKRFGILMADSKSHGMAASLLGVLVKVRLEEMKERFPDSKSFVEFLNKEIKGVSEHDISSLSLFYGIFDRASLTFQYTGAGHLRPMICRLGETPELTSHQNPALGGADPFDFQQVTLRLQPGDQVVLFTDGWDHLFQGQAAEHIRKIVAQHASQPTLSTALTTELMGMVDAFKLKTPLKDDLTVIQFSVQEKAIYLVQK